MAIASSSSLPRDPSSSSSVPRHRSSSVPPDPSSSSVLPGRWSSMSPDPSSSSVLRDRSSSMNPDPSRALCSSSTHNPVISAAQWHHLPPAMLVMMSAAVTKPSIAKELLTAALVADETWAESAWVRLFGTLDEYEAAFLSCLCDRSNKRNGTLHLAISLGQTMQVESLISRQQDLNSLCGGATPLMFAIQSEYSKLMVKLLLNSGADPNKAAWCGLRPLHIAILKKDATSVQLLMKNGANPKLRDKLSVAPLEMARVHGFPGCEELLGEQSSPVSGYGTDWTVQGSVNERNGKSEMIHEIVEVPESEHSDEDGGGDDSGPPPLVVSKHDNENQDDDKANSNDEKEKLRKAKDSFVFSHVDKIPTSLLAACTAGLAAIHLADKVVTFSDFELYVFAVGSVVGVAGGISLFAYASYYKEKGPSDNCAGAIICSTLVLVAHLYLLGVMCLGVAALNKVNPKAVFYPGGLLAL